MLNDILKKHKNKTVSKYSFNEFLKEFDKNPKSQSRNAAMYIRDVFDYFGKNKKRERYNLFHSDLLPGKKIFGNEKTQELIYQSLNNFVEEGYCNKLLLLVGPNGSAKTSIVNKIMEACEYYSTQDEGKLFSFSWVFPLGGAGYNKQTPIGFTNSDNEKVESYAHLKPNEIGSIISSELRDHPILIIPRKARQEYLAKVLDRKSLSAVKKTYLYNGDLSKQNKDIFNTLLKQYEGDYNQVFKHIRVERYEISRRYSKSVATVEPQMHVDAEVRQITMDNNIRNLPSNIQALNLTTSTGELVFANRGILEFSDFFKRNFEANKYLLMTVESRNLNVRGILTELDILFFGTSNELQYEAFKTTGDFKSFKARFKTIHVPYLLSFKDEKHIYQEHVKDVDLSKFERHALEAFSLWAVMTRLHEPKEKNYPDNQKLRGLVKDINPLDKALVYAGYSNQIDRKKFSRKEYKVIKKSKKALMREFMDKKVPLGNGNSISYYEGYFGISPREAKEILLNLCQKNKNISFFEVLNFVENFKKDEIYGDEKIVDLIGIIEKQQNSKSAYKNNKERVELIKEHYKKKFDEELRESLELVDTTAYEDYIRKYVIHANAYLQNEKIFNKETGRTTDMDIHFLESFEEKIGATESPIDFRSQIISKVGKYALEHKKKPENYCELFKEEIFLSLKNNFIDSQREMLSQLMKELQYYNKGEDTKNKGLIDKVVKNLEKKYRYSKDTALKLISFVYDERG